MIRSRGFVLGSLLCLLAAGRSSATTSAALGTSATTDAAAAFPFVLGQVLAADGDLAAALDAYGDAIRRAPDDPFIRLARAELLAQTGQAAKALEEVAEIRRLAPGERAAARLQARIAMTRADRDPDARRLAMEGFETWLEEDADDVEALVSLGQLHLAAGEPKRAAERLGRAARLRPGQAMIDGLLSRALAQSGDVAEAEAVQRELLAAHPERLDVRFELSEALLGNGRAADAESLLAGAPTEQQKSPELRRRRAIARMLAGDVDGAREIAAPLHEELPENAAVRVLLATIEQADGRWERVVELLDPVAARAAAPDSVVSLEIEALERLGRLDEAIAKLDGRAAAQAAAGQAGDAFSTAALAADLALRGKRWAEAERRAAALKEMPVGEEDAGRRRWAVAWLAADAAAGREDWQAALVALDGLDQPAALARRYELAKRAGLSPVAAAARATLAAGDTDARLALADAEARGERFAEAESLYAGVLAGQPEQQRARFGLGMALERQGRREAAEAEFEKLLAASPEHAPTLNYLGYMWIEKARNLDRAVDMVRRAVRSDPANGAYVDSLGWGMLQLGRAGEAVRLLERASRLEPDDATILEHLGDAAFSAGDLARARSAWERALALAGENRDLSEKIARLPHPSGAS